ncbi:MAG: hypothetical protein JWO05_1418 [Gemmatimonadetes bacterium]|nr:hypothetical protein [Gemmatimonadota bacterium]
MSPLLEVAVVSVAEAIEAEALGAARLEVCVHLDVGGTTPSPALVRDIRAAVAIPLAVLIRPRAGDFTYSHHEFAQMRHELDASAEAGAHDVVIGAITREGLIDMSGVTALVDRARELGLGVAFHRAFDRVRDPLEEIETLLDLRIDRILTSGGAPTAIEGKEVLRMLVERAGKDLTILAGGGVRDVNVLELVRYTGVREVHCSAPAARAVLRELRG